MRVALFGCKATTRFMLEALRREFEITHLITISPALGAKFDVADYCDLEEEAQGQGIEVYSAKTYSLKNEADIEAINAMRLDLAFVIGWQRLIPDLILQNVRIGVFGMHGSSMNLPLGRGRSPMNWSLIEGRQFFYTNLFKYDAGVDSGDVADTFLFSITPHDTAETLHFKNMLAMKRLILKNADSLRAGTFTLQKQPEITPTYYPKRTPADSLIDWESDIFQIERFIRAVTRPFNGAYTFAGEYRVILYRAHIFETELVDYGYGDRPAGSVVEVLPGGKFLVRCQGGLLLVHEYEAEVPITVGMVFGDNGETRQVFPRNRFGNFDTELDS